MSFSKNGVNWGVAFEEPEFKTCNLYPACAPIYKDDSFSLRMLIKED